MKSSNRNVTTVVARLVAGAFLVVLGAHCGKETTTEPPSPPPPQAPTIAIVTVTPSIDTLTALGEGVGLQVSATNSIGGAVGARAYTWTSDDELVATVSSTGVVIAIGNGTTKINATTEGVTGAATIVVQQVATSVSVDADRSTLTAIGDTTTAVVTASDARGNSIFNPPTVWSSSDSAVLGVGEDGLVTAVGPGTAEVIGVVHGVGAGDTVQVVQSVDTVAVTPGTGVMSSIGATVQLIAIANDVNGNAIAGSQFVWSTADATLATVDQSGLVTAVDNGVVTIRAAANGATGSAIITVQRVVRAVALSPGLDTATALGDTLLFTATGLDSLGSVVASAMFAWTTSDVGVATVDSAGRVVTISDGSTVITATTNSIAGMATIVVDQQPAALAMSTQPNGAAAGIAFATQPTVNVIDARGNQVLKDSNSAITAAIDSGGGTLRGTLTNPAAGGTAAFRDLSIGGLVGDRRLRFDSPGLSSVTSQPASVGPGVAVSLIVAAGDSQIGLAATGLPNPLAVAVADSFGNHVPGIDVGWTVIVGGSLTDTTTTDLQGVANNVYTLGVFAGTDTVEAAVFGLSGSPQRLIATATPNATITGTVTSVGGFLAPPMSSNISTSAGKAQSTPTPPMEYVSGELIVTFRRQGLALPSPSRDPSRLATARGVGEGIRTALAVASQRGGYSLTGVSPVTLTARILVADPSSLGTVEATLKARADVATVARNRIYGVPPTTTTAMQPLSTAPSDPLYPFQAWHYSIIDVPEAWDRTTGSANVLVAVVDDGIRFDHPGIAPNVTTDGYDFVSSITLNLCAGGTIDHGADGDGYDSDPTNPLDATYNSFLQCVGPPKTAGNHGLHVAGTIGSAGNDNIGGSGINWNVRIRPVRVCGLVGCTSYDIAQGILYASGLPADNGSGGLIQAPSRADIINLSLGGPGINSLIADAVRKADSVGVLIIASAGNDASSTPSYPAAYPEVISVSAVNPFGTLAAYSNYGLTIDVAAPGGELAFGGSWGVWSAAWDYVNGSPLLAGWQGTSMAAPHVSGVAALLLANEPSLNNTDLKSRIRTYAVDVGAAGKDQLYGHGLLNARNSLTQSFEPPHNTYALLVDKATGATVSTQLTSSAGGYSFGQLSDGDYLVYAGQDADGDQIIGEAFKRWGALGGSATPTPITVSGATTHTASFSIGLPLEQEANETFQTANQLSPGGYTAGTTASAQDLDIFAVHIPTNGTYTFETRADGACGFGPWEDTVLQIFDGDGNLIALNDDIDAAAFNYCSQITQLLQSGLYYAVVSGSVGGAAYYLEVR